MGNDSVRPFVKPGESLGFVAPLKDRGLWPPPLRDPDHPNRGDTATPFLVIPTTAGTQDEGQRPQPNSKAFHSTGVWLEDAAGAVVPAPVVGGEYRIRCRIRNLGAFPAYGGLADFFVNTPEAFTTAAGTSAALPAIGHTGFSLLQGQEAVISCPNTWKPATAADLASSILVHGYDLFTDNLTGRFDARNDRHVGRHDLSPDVYVRDWTDSAALHDDGIEPSARGVFYHTSDVWNRRTAGPAVFAGDQPQNEDPQSGNGAAGDNFIYARVSRNDASSDQTLRAHFMFAEFGTGSPFVNCSADPDPAVTLLAGELSASVSLPWHLHPSSSSHLCLAVQIYSDGDPYVSPGLLGYTPGWPTTDMMVINDNNKAQRNVGVQNSIPNAEGIRFGIVFNAATFTRDVTLAIDASRGAQKKLRNARVSVPASALTQEFVPGTTLVLKQMLPGERRWVSFSYDAVSFSGAEDSLTVYFGERVQHDVVNGFAFDLRPATPDRMVPSVLAFQSAVFYRMSEGLGIAGAREGVALCQKLLTAKANLAAYIEALPTLTRLLADSLKALSMTYGGMKDSIGVNANLERLGGMTLGQGPAALALHDKVLHQADAMQTMATKMGGDTADILFTTRLQRAIYAAGDLGSSDRFRELLKRTDDYIQAYGTKDGSADSYVRLVTALAKAFEATVGIIATGPVKARYSELVRSMTRTPAEIQKAHLNFLNAVLQSSRVPA